MIRKENDAGAPILRMLPRIEPENLKLRIEKVT